MSTFVDYDPLTGVETHADADDMNRLQVHYRQDVENVIDLATRERNEGVADKRSSLNLYARIPPVVIMEMKNKYGVDIFKRDHLKRAFELLNREYPRLKTTYKTHTVQSHG